MNYDGVTKVSPSQASAMLIAALTVLHICSIAFTPDLNGLDKEGHSLHGLRAKCALERSQLEPRVDTVIKLSQMADLTRDASAGRDRVRSLSRRLDAGAEEVQPLRSLA